MARPVSKHSVSAQRAAAVIKARRDETATREEAALAAMPEPEVIIHDDVPQDSDEWRKLRLGLATASEFSTIMSESDAALTRTKLLRQLAGEVLTGEPKSDFSNRYTDRGKALEPVARDWYMRTRLTAVQQVGFVFNKTLNAGWSPDGLVGDDGALEIKCVEPHILIGILERGVFPPEHRPQCFGGAFVIGRRQWLDLVIYSHEKIRPFVARIEPNPAYQATIAREIERFNWDLQTLVKKIRSMQR